MIQSRFTVALVSYVSIWMISNPLSLSASLPDNQTVKRPVSQSDSQLISQSINQSASRSVDQPVTQTAETDIQFSQSVRSTDKQTNRQTDRCSVSQSISQSEICHSLRKDTRRTRTITRNHMDTEFDILFLKIETLTIKYKRQCFGVQKRSFYKRAINLQL